MVPAHVAELVKLGWNAKTEDLPNGIKLTVITSDLKELTKLKALGFMGIMVQGGHHQPHHLMMAKGEHCADWLWAKADIYVQFDCASAVLRANGCHKSARITSGTPAISGSSQYMKCGKSRQRGNCFPLST